MGKKADPKKELERVQEELDAKEAALEQERLRASQAHERDRAELESMQQRLEKERDDALKERDAAAAAVKIAEEERNRLNAEKRDVEEALAENKLALERQRQMTEDSKLAFEKELDVSRQKLKEDAADKASTHQFLDVAIGECEFANAFSYFLSVQLGSDGIAEKQSTDVSQPSTRPVFKRPTFLLAAAGANIDVKDELRLSAFISVVDPAAVESSPVTRMLGETKVPLVDLQVPDGETTSRRVIKNVTFHRSGGNDAGRGSTELAVGRATVALQVKVMRPSEVASKTDAARAQASDAPLPPAAPSLNKTLWPARPLQPCLRVLAHWAEGLPLPPQGGRATGRITLRLLRSDGQVVHEATSPDVNIVTSATVTPAGEVNFGYEILLPLHKAVSGSSKEVTVQLALEMISTDAAAGGAAHLATVLDLRWFCDALPPFGPFHVLAKPSESGSTAPSFVRPRPSLFISLVSDPSHEILDGLGDGASGYCAEFRVHSVPPGRPLPEPAEGAIVAICSEPRPDGTYQIPVATFLYDQRMDFTTFVSSHFKNGVLKDTSYFLTPIATRSRTPQWGQYVLRCLASLGSLQSFSVLVLDCGETKPGVRGDGYLNAKLLGFTTLDASSLVPPRDGSDQNVPMPLHRSFLLDLRLMEDPGASSSIEVECRVWPRGGIPERCVPIQDGGTQASPSGVRAGQHSLNSARERAVEGSVTGHDIGPSGLINGGASSAVAAAQVQYEASEFRLSHELSVQLSKEFNLRAAALKRAGEEIVALRRQLQLLQHENLKLKAQVEDEEQLAGEIQKRPIPEGLDSLSSAELAQKLQRALEKYREEKSKGVELTHRLEEALREVSRGRGLQRTLNELEQAHLEQNKELQRLQEEGKKLDTYRQTTKTQEKVIGKLEKILEGSLAEVQKAQRVQVDVERLKTENLRLREKCAQLVANTRKASTGTSGDNEEHLRKQIAAKEADVIRLEGMVRDLQGAQQATPESPEVVQQRRQLGELEDSRAEWEQRCNAAEQRLTMLQRQLEDSSKKYGAEITALKVEIAKRDAKVLELEYRLGKVGGGGGEGDVSTADASQPLRGT